MRRPAGNGVTRLRRQPAVVDGRADRQDRAVVQQERGRPVRGGVAPAARTSSPWRRSDASVEYAFVETLPTKVWLCERPGLRGVDDRVVAGAVAEAAGADEVRRRYQVLRPGGTTSRRGAARGEGHGRHQHAEGGAPATVVPGLP